MPVESTKKDRFIIRRLIMPKPRFDLWVLDSETRYIRMVQRNQTESRCRRWIDRWRESMPGVCLMVPVSSFPIVFWQLQNPLPPLPHSMSDCEIQSRTISTR